MYVKTNFLIQNPLKFRVRA